MTELAELFAASMRLHDNLLAYAETHPEQEMAQSIEKAERLARELGARWAKEPD